MRDAVSGRAGPAAPWTRIRRLLSAPGEAREMSRETLAAVEGLSAQVDVLGQRQTELAVALQHLHDRIEAVARDATTRDEALSVAVGGLRGEHAQAYSELLTGLKRVHADEARQRRRLREVRTTEAYERAYTEPDPLVSVLIATYNRLDTLRKRVIPSILAQDYRNIEIVIVGDQAPYGHSDIAEGFGDAPIRFTNLEMRGPYPDDHERLWMVAGTPPFNEALHQARGAWLAWFSDDDAMRPNHLRTLVGAARERRLELAYGRMQDHHLDQPLGAFPPRWGQIGLQAAVFHSALRIFELELSDADFRTPNDMGMVDRLLRAGVRFGMVDEIVADYYPSLRGLGGDQPPIRTR